MLSRAPRSQGGFTLIELMVAVLVIGILAAIALPSYGQYLVRSNRAAAQAYLVELSQAQAQFRADSRSYAASLDELGLEVPDHVSAKYDITIELEEGPPQGYKILATPVAGGSQAGDGELSLDQAGTRTPDDKW